MICRVLHEAECTLVHWLGTVKLNYKVSSPWRLSCQVLPTAPKFSMACHGSGSRSHFPPPSAAQRLSVSSSRSGRCFGIMIPCLCQLASHGSTEDDRCCSHIVSAPCPPPPDIDPLALPADAQTEDQKELKLFRRRAPDCYCIGAVLNQLSWSWRECVDNRQVAVCQLELHKLSSSEVRGFSMNEP